MSWNLQRYSTLLFILAFCCAVLMLTGRTYGNRTTIQTVFFISGAVALILNLISSRQEAHKDEFNILFWLGSLLMFIGLLFKTYYLPFWNYVTFTGMAVSGMSYFINPFSSSKDKDQEDELLDQ